MKNILEEIEKARDAYPEKIAVADDKKQITYRELIHAAQRIGCGVHISMKEKRNCPVAIYMDKTPECVVAMLGTIYSGNFYTVIDTKMPLVRVKKIFETLDPKLIITDKKYKPDLEKIWNAIPIYSFEEILIKDWNEKYLHSIRKSMVDTDPVYALYTSGSTGRPKGAIISHHALLSYTDWFIQAFHITYQEIFGSQTPLYFSMSVSELYGALRTGATYQIIPKTYFSFPLQLMEYMDDKKINIIYWVPYALCIVANLDTFSYQKPHFLKKVLFAGESMPTKQLNYWRSFLPNLWYANLFGPTETTDICCYYTVDKTFANEESLPIGTACEGCELLIVDEDGKESDYGELLVKGPFLAMGYYNDPKKTEESFIQNPFNPYYKEIVYKTGDLVQKKPSGEIIYRGRKDYQIKHMGYRIEPGEIESAVSSLEEIESCVCIYDEKKDKIIMIYQGGITESAMRDYFDKKLPVYMHPGEYLNIKKMPQNANGKIDRFHLKNHYEKYKGVKSC